MTLFELKSRARAVRELVTNEALRPPKAANSALKKGLMLVYAVDCFTRRVARKKP